MRTTPRAVAGVLAAATAGVILTRWPVARVEPFDSDEFHFLATARAHWFPNTHTLFFTLGRLFGGAVGDAYRGFVALGIVTSALALTAVWWWLRAVVKPSTAAAATLALAAAPVFWGYGAMAGSYAVIVAVGSFLLGVAARTRSDPRPWHPYAAAAVLALGTGYRQDIGVLWLPVLLVILWQHRWARAAGAGAVFTALNLTWIGLMLHEAGGWNAYRESTRDFAHQAGYLNSVWNLGLVDAPVRYAAKLVMALLWTFGPGLAFAPRGLIRLAREGSPDRGLAPLLVLSVVPALGLHLLVHFGVPGYAFHYVPALVGLIALGIGRAPATAPAGAVGAVFSRVAHQARRTRVPRGSVLRTRAGWPGLTGTGSEYRTTSHPFTDLVGNASDNRCSGNDHAPARLAALAALLAAVFLFYPTDFTRPGFRGDFDLSFARHTRLGLSTRPPLRSPSAWRTANSRPIGDGRPARRDGPHPDPLPQGERGPHDSSSRERGRG